MTEAELQTHLLKSEWIVTPSLRDVELPSLKPKSDDCSCSIVARRADIMVMIANEVPLYLAEHIAALHNDTR